ncbi:hypothetical protein [Paenibacillus sp. GCM10027626]
MKIELSRTFPDDIHQYQEGKQPFIHALMERALVWAEADRRRTL